MLTPSLILTLITQLAPIEGQVRDARTHAPIRAARIELWHAQVPVALQYTDSDGGFRFSSIPAGNFMISVDHPEYDSSSVVMETPAPPLVSIELVQKKPVEAGRGRVVTLREFLIPTGAQKEFAIARKEVSRSGCANAVPHFENGLRTYDQDASAHNDLGNCYRKLGQLDLAEHSYERARALSDSVYVSLNLAEVYTARRQFKEAEAVMREVIRKNPNAGDAHYGLGLVYLCQDLTAMAESAMLQAAARPHRIADVHLVLAEIYTRDQKLSEARQQLQEYLKEEPHGPRSDQIRQALKKRR